MEELTSKDIKLLFICDPSEAINECQKIICSVSNFSSFQDFYNYHLKNSHVSTCQNEWSTHPQMSIHCDDCSNSQNSCICLQCFLNGNHEGHTYVINPNSTGNCDCGDLSLWKRSGFCTEHHGLENDSHPEDYLDEKLRTTLTDIAFKGAFSAIKNLTDDDGTILSTIYQFLISFLKFGDGFRRLLVISLTERINFDKFFDSIFEASYEFNSLLQNFCGLLINDQLFKYKFSPVNLRLMLTKIVPLGLKEIETGIGNRSIEPWIPFWFHGYQRESLKYCIDHKQFNLIEFTIQILNYYSKLVTFLGKPLRRVPEFFYEFSSVFDAAVFLNEGQFQNLFDLLFTDVLSRGSSEDHKKHEAYIATTFLEDTQPGYYHYLINFNTLFYSIFDVFKSKENLKFDKMFDELDKVDVRPIFLIGKNVNGTENDKFVSQLIKMEDHFELNSNESSYNSFLKGGGFYVSHPLLYSLAHLMRNDNMCRVKIAQFLKMEKYSSLRVRLGILAVKSAIAQICSSQSLVPQSNLGIINILRIYDDNPVYCSNGISLLFPLLQLLIGLQCDSLDFSLKEFYAFEVAREIGFFDSEEEIPKDQEEKMFFSFLYFSLLLVVERTLFNFDGNRFIKEQIIFELKKGTSDLNELKKLCCVFVNTSSSTGFNRIVSEVSTIRQKVKKGQNKNSGDQDVTFELKEGIEYNFLSAINSFNQNKTIMNDTIQKHPESLIKIPQFEREETYFFHENDEINTSGLNVKLNEYLATPTVLATVYKTLRKDDDGASQKVELNEHLAMNILVLVSKFIRETNDNSDEKTLFNESTIIEYDSSLIDLISKLKRSVFELNFESNGQATIKNKLTSKTFNLFMKMKIKPKDGSPKSFVDLLLEKGQLGKNVLGQMSVQIEGVSNDEEKQDLTKLKKLRAQKLKEQIMNHYKTITTNFNKDDEENDEKEEEQLSNNDKDICMICSNTRKNEVLSYPLYIYRTKFPFIIDKPQLVTIPMRTAMKETEVYKDEDNESTNNNESNDDDDEDEIPDPEDVFAQILSQMPDLDITSDMSEEDIERRRSTIERIHQTVTDQYIRVKEAQEMRKKQRQEEKLLRIQKEKEEMIEREKQLENPEMPVTKQLTPGNLFVIQFGICQHLVHPDCVNEDDFTCPIDRSFKNGFLPNIDDLSKNAIYADRNSFELSNELKDSLNLFINKYSLFFRASNEKVVDLFVELVKSLSGLISTYEVRLRSLPDCLDSKKTKLLSRNLFLTTWYAYRMRGKPSMKTGFSTDISEDVDSKLTVFQKFIKKLIECDKLEESVTQKKESLQRILSSFNNNKKVTVFSSEKEHCLFLRRVCLADYFLLKQDDREQKLIDWDEILSVDNLSQKFEVTFKCDDFDFRPFIFSKLPKDFLRFAQDPYNFPVEQTRHFTLFNLLNYNRMIQCYNDVDETENDSKIDYKEDLLEFNEVNAKELLSILQKKCSKLNYPSVFLFIGRESSSIAVIDGKRPRILPPFYLDKYGCADVGFQRKEPIFLNEERYDRVIDQILSGDFSNGSQPS
ncbi:hypothetical protein M9Y10_027855 [Tritrichomonas musculus]|uniref:E3 ubiquitin-protein ligase n=1 Tax=Tritrichomonas musculus TaxID=1915356 RepID=A0ABR2H461_9EUKA